MDWSQDTIVPSVQHGAAAIESWAVDYKDAITLFVTSGDVASKGLVGCPKCYDNLPQTIARLVATVQPGASAVATSRGHEPGVRLSSLARLQLELAAAVGNEDYERAARVRDEIRSLAMQSDTDRVGGQ